MGRYRHSQMFLNVGYYLLIFCVADFRPLVVGGFFKLVTALLLAYLLAFVVIHSPNIYKLVAASFRFLPISFFPLVLARRLLQLSQTDVVVPNEPSLSSLFQRPPPIFSL
jgi:hypothetical protein